MALGTSGTVSERHEAARQDESKITAGQLARAMRARGHDVKAAELAEFAPEWHHSGFRGDGKGMGKTYFFPASWRSDEREMRLLAEHVAARRAERAEPRFAFNVRFRKSGRRWQPVAEIIEVPAGKRLPDKATVIERAQFERLQPFDGRDLEAYEAADAFERRMLGGAR